MKKSWKEKRHTFNWFRLLIVALLLYFFMDVVHQQMQLNQIGADQAAAAVRLQEAEKENEALKQERDSLSDPDNIEKIAREELGMTKPGELPYSRGKKNQQ